MLIYSAGMCPSAAQERIERCCLSSTDTSMTHMFMNVHTYI